VRPEDYYPDPTGNGLYEIQSVEKDLHEVIRASEGDDPIYDPAAVRELIDTDYSKPLEEKRTDADRNQEEAAPPAFRKRVVITEFWGTILNEDGTVMHENVLAAVANGRHLIRKPEPNPFWHQESPFVVVPLLRVPFSVWHRALYDDPADLNLAINEMFNLMLDGGIASVWGIKQLRTEDLEDPSQVEHGIPQGITLKVKQTLPPNVKVLEKVVEGEVPQDAMAVFEFLNREFANSVLTNELKLGSLPPKQVKATEVVEASQSQAITLDGIIADMEYAIARVLRLAWYTILQNMDDIPTEALEDVTDRQVALLLSRASPEERFSLFFGKTNLKVFGLNATLQKAMHFQKLVAMLQLAMQNPLLLRAFIRRFSGDKALRMVMRALNVNVDDLEKDQEELAQIPQETAEMAALGGAATGGGPEGGQSAAGAAGTAGTPLGGGSGVPAEINQLSNTRTGLTPNA
jgi:hypothetical protein